jgi:hypothetical protein
MKLHMDSALSMLYISLMNSAERAICRALMEMNGYSILLIRLSMVTTHPLLGLRGMETEKEKDEAKQLKSRL